MKKLLACLTAALILITALTACQSKDPSVKNEKLAIVCTIFPQYDWIKQILGSHARNAELTMLLENGVDLHSYQPSADDIIKISKADIFIYVGGESDTWVKDALKESVNKNMTVINLLDVLGDSIKEEQLTEGMQSEEDEASEEADKDNGPEYDEHVWLSLKNAKALSNKIAEVLCKKDSVNADDYSKNAKAYIEKLDNLDKTYSETVNSSKTKTLLFGDRFPFRYLTDDYGLKYYAAFVGCSAETEASFETITFLAKKADEQNLGSIITIDGGKHKIAETIRQNTKSKAQKIVSLNSMQSVTSNDVKNGATYLSIMQDNLAVLKEALK